jgi:ATP-dependent protease HslVU (ClpYQ) peptidase subunit
MNDALLKTEPSKFRKYFIEYCIIALAGATVTLFWMFNDLNKYIRQTQTEQLIRVNDALNRSTNVTDQFLNYQRYRNDNNAKFDTSK